MPTNAFTRSGLIDRTDSVISLDNSDDSDDCIVVESTSESRSTSRQLSPNRPSSSQVCLITDEESEGEITDSEFDQRCENSLKNLSLKFY